MHKNKHICPACGSQNTRKRGNENNIQSYSCNDCRRRFRNEHRNAKSHIEIYFDYVFGKQTIRELSRDGYGSKNTIINIRDEIILPTKIHTPRLVHLNSDATYFGSRKQGTSWGILVFRDTDTREDIWWKFIHSRETKEDYHQGRIEIEKQGYTIGSITVDGFPGLQGVFEGIPFQYCQVHMERTCITYLTRKPKTTPGQALLSLVYSMKELTKHQFIQSLQEYITYYYVYLNQKTYHSRSGRSSYTHKRLRGCIRTLSKNIDVLFTFESDSIHIHKDTNSLEGHFSHIKDILKVHRGISKKHKMKALSAIMLASTIAPDRDIFD